MTGLVAAALLLASLYSLPEGAALPEPDGSQRTRIARDMAVLRRADGEAQTDAAVRDLALVGLPALGTVVDRLQQAEAGERLLLLAAVSRIPEAAPLLAQARRDPHPAVRAWCSVPARKDPALRLLARRYLDILALAEQKRSDEADEDLKRMEPGTYARWTRSLAPRQLIELRERMKDRRYAEGIHRQRSRAARRFAMRGARALREGELVPDAQDPVFLAYLALLREESSAFYHALTALVEVGEPLAPVLEPLLAHENHDPEKLLRVIHAVRPDRGLGLYSRFDAYRPEVQRALVPLAPETLTPDALAAFLERAALAGDGSVRVAALDHLLELEAPIGARVAKRLFDPERYGRQEFARAAKLMVRAGDLEVVSQYASILVPEDGTEMGVQLRNARRASRMALKAQGGAEVERLGDEYLRRESTATRRFGLDLVRAVEKLNAIAREEADPRLAGYAAQRALEEGEARTALQTVGIIRERGLEVSFVGWEVLTRTRCEAALLALAADPSTGVSNRALHRLALLPTIDPSREAALLRLWKGADERNREDLLGALLPLGTPAVRAIFIEVGEEAIPVLRSRAQGGGAIPFDLPVENFLEGADAERLEDLGLIVQALPSAPPLIYDRLLGAWRGITASALEEREVDVGPAEQRTRLLEAMARSDDVASIEKLFRRLVTEKEPQPQLILGGLKAAALHLAPERLADLVPALRRHLPGEYALDERVQPPFDPVRRRMLWGGINCLAWRRVDAGLPFLCDLILDPALSPASFDWKGDGRGGSAVPHWAREALRHYPAVKVNTAFRRALERAEQEGRLALLTPDYLLEHARLGQEGRDRGRPLNEVGVALCEVLERLPWEGRVGYEKMRALGGLKRYEEAAAAARASAGTMRSRGVRSEDGFWSAERMVRRARLYEALGAGDVSGFQWVATESVRDPVILFVAGFYLRYFLGNPPLATRYAEDAVRATAGLHHPYRDLLAAQRISAGRPEQALRLLDPDRRLPVRRNAGANNRRFLMYLAKARLALGDTKGARRDLESALQDDKRILPEVLADPAFKLFADLYPEIESDYLDYCFRWGD